jgi:hypothetical protein
MLHHAAASANCRQAFWSELALREFVFKFEGEAQTFKHVMRYNFNMWVLVVLSPPMLAMTAVLQG